LSECRQNVVKTSSHKTVCVSDAGLVRSTKVLCDFAGLLPNTVGNVSCVSRKDSTSRKNLPLDLLAVACAAMLTGVLVGVVPPLPATRFANAGHWVYNWRLVTPDAIVAARPRCGEVVVTLDGSTPQAPGAPVVSSVDIVEAVRR
jgi:hypothetical protein